jgi:pyrroloquinoline quinone biosynthesis protein D
VSSVEKRLKVAPSARLRWDKVDGRHVLLSPERGLSLNATATEVVQLCDGTLTASDIVQRCTEKYGHGSAIEEDVRTWLGELIARGLVVEYTEG